MTERELVTPEQQLQTAVLTFFNGVAEDNLYTQSTPSDTLKVA